MESSRRSAWLLAAALVAYAVPAAAQITAFDPPRELPLAPNLDLGRDLPRFVVDRDSLVVGAPAGRGGRGVVQIFSRRADAPERWREMARRLGPGSGGTGFGSAVALDGDVLLVGAPRELTGGAGSGAVYVFYRDRGGPSHWRQVRRVTAGATGFGSRVALSGDTAVVAADGELYVLDRHRGGPDRWYGQRLGPSFALDTLDVAISGDTLAIGTVRRASGAPRHHRIGIFERDAKGPAGWRQVRVLRPPDGVVPPAGAVDGRFGEGFSLDGSTLVVPNFGQVYIYERARGGAGLWSRRRSLDLPDSSQPEFEAFNGCRLEPPLAFRGNTIAVNTSDLNASGLAFEDCGAEVLVFERDQGGRNRWGAVARLERPDPATLNPVAVGPREVLLGSSGLSYFQRRPIVADDFEAGNLLAWSAASGDVAVVAPGLGGSPSALASTLDGAGGSSFLHTRLPRREPRFSMSFLMAANRIELGRDSVAVLRIAGGRTHLLLLLAHDRAFRAEGQPAGDYYRMSLWSRRDYGTWEFHGRMFIPPMRAVKVDLAWERATGPGHDNGYIRIWRDGVLRLVADGLDNDELSVDDLFLGLPLGPLGTVSDSRGSLLFDDVVLER